MFKPYINNVHRFAHGEYYWHIFENDVESSKILFVGGSVERLLPISREELQKTSPKEFFNFFHPEDVAPTFSFLLRMFEILNDTPENEREYLTCTIYLRIKNASGVYQWNSMQYPHIHYKNSTIFNFKYAMVLYTNVNHLSDNFSGPMLTILNANPKGNQELAVYYAEKTVRTSNVPNITKREKEVIALLSQGKSSKQISYLLGIAKSTVDNHRQRLLRKFKVESSAQLVSSFIAGNKFE